MNNIKEKEHFLRIFCSEQLRQEKENHAEAVELVVSSGALKKCHDEASAMLKEQWRSFAKFAHHNDAKIMLKMFLFSILISHMNLKP